MAGRFQFFGSPPFPILIDHLVGDEDFVNDAKRIIDIEEPSFEHLQERLIGITSFLDRATLTAEVESVLGKGKDATEVSRTIWRLSAMLRESEEPFSECVELLRSTIQEKMTALEPEHRTNLADRLERLAVNPTGLNRQFKARQVANFTGKELDDLNLVCDIRPVFSADRTNIDGAIVVTTLRLNLVDNGTSSSLDIRLTEEQLHDLFESVTVAEAKVTAIKGLLERKSISTPNLNASTTQKDTK